MKHAVPHDTSDLLLAPIALQLDENLSRLSGLDRHALDLAIALGTNTEPRGTDSRHTLLLEELTRFVELHDWSVSWDPRGLALQHDGRSIVLGLPESVRTYLGS